MIFIAEVTRISTQRKQGQPGELLFRPIFGKSKVKENTTEGSETQSEEVYTLEDILS